MSHSAVASAQPGTLYVVATPIGNLDDISARALRVLRDVALIAAEDTRHSVRLLQHFGIETPLAACHEHNERDQGGRFLAKLEAGEDVAWAVEQVQARAVVPEVVVVVLGTNPSGDATGFGADVRSLLRELRRRGAEHVAWLTPAHRDEDRYDEKVAVLQRVEGIDLLADWAAEAAADPGTLLADGLHPSEEGYAELAEFLVATAIDVDH